MFDFSFLVEMSEKRGYERGRQWPHRGAGDQRRLSDRFSRQKHASDDDEDDENSNSRRKSKKLKKDK